MKKTGLILGLTEFILAVSLAVGAAYIFDGCEAVDGKFMACHWAQNAVVLIGAVLAAAVLIGLVIPNDGFKAGLALAVFLFSIAAALIPQNVINLCMMDTMRCHTAFRPAVIAVSAILAVVSGAHTVIGIIYSRRKR